jgi:ATP-dependent RNA helicase DHX8/PRP22
MLCGTDDEEEVDEEGVDVFGIIREGEDVDFVRLHMMMLRECRRLNEGLPIYAYRTKILNHIFNNQVRMRVLCSFQ